MYHSDCFMDGVGVWTTIFLIHSSHSTKTPFTSLLIDKKRPHQPFYLSNKTHVQMIWGPQTLHQPSPAREPILKRHFSDTNYSFNTSVAPFGTRDFPAIIVCFMFMEIDVVQRSSFCNVRH